MAEIALSSFCSTLSSLDRQASSIVPQRYRSQAACEYQCGGDLYKTKDLVLLPAARGGSHACRSIHSTTSCRRQTWYCTRYVDIVHRKHAGNGLGSDHTPRSLLCNNEMPSVGLYFAKTTRMVLFLALGSQYLAAHSIT